MSRRGLSGDRPTVGHFVRTYFRLTENWIHTQICHLSRFRPVVFTEETENLGDVPAGELPEIVSLRERGRLVQLLNKAARTVLGRYPSFARPARRHGLDLIHAHFGPVGCHALPVARKLGIPLLVRFYGKDVSWLPTARPRWRDRYRELFEEGDQFLVEGPAMARQLAGLGCPEAKIEVQPLGIDLDQFPPACRLRSGEDPLRILMVGRFVEKKGFPYGLEAVARLRDEGRRVSCTLVGGPGNSDRGRREAERIRRVIEESDLAGTVTLPGRIPHRHLRESYYDHDVLLAPSVTAEDGDNEGGAPVTALEAAATGLPVVATRHRDLTTVVAHERTGLLVPERDPEAMTRALDRLAEDPSLAIRYGQAARRRAEENFDARKQVGRLEQTYDEVLQGRDRKTTHSGGDPEE